uniref:Uncharacterized protein n=1 Tax=Leersia perrieri TaxID=77586 RepID=A0A0D9WK82_9ORYZ
MDLGCVDPPEVDDNEPVAQSIRRRHSRFSTLRLHRRCSPPLDPLAAHGRGLRATWHGSADVVR